MTSDTLAFRICAMVMVEKSRSILDLVFVCILSRVEVLLLCNVTREDSRRASSVAHSAIQHTPHDA